MSGELFYAPARAIADAVRERRCSVREVVDLHLDRIAEVNPRLNAVVRVSDERARKEAEAADARIAGGDALGPLNGVPITIKDSLDTEGIVTTGGTEGRRRHVPSTDAPVVARLRAVGAIILGKTNTPELTLGDNTENAVYGRTNNPYDPDYSPSGSSGGAAAIIAAGGAALDLGSDTGGSIRGPAYACGIAGIKPTSGRVSRTGHITPPGFGALDSLTQVGPLARFVEDLTLVLPIVSGVDWQDSSVVPVPLGDPRSVDLRGLRLLVYADNGVFNPEPEIHDLVTAVARALDPEVAGIESLATDLFAEGMEVLMRLRNADGGATVRRLLKRCGTVAPFEELAGILAATPPAVSGEAFSQILEDVETWRSRMLGLMQAYDAILCPASPFGPERHGIVHRDRYRVWSHCMVYNLAGWPAAVVRAGTTETGLPLGIQIVGRPWCEDVVLAIAQAVESLCGGFEPPKI